MIFNGLLSLLMRGNKGLFDWFILLVCLIMVGTCIWSRSVLLKKAGRKPWCALIPGYSSYSIYDICWIGRYGIIDFILSILIYVLMPIDQKILSTGIRGIILIIIYTIFFILSSIMKMKLCRSFGKNMYYAFGLIFAEEISYPVIAITSKEYLGRTLRKYNPVEEPKKLSVIKQNKQYLIDLQKKRSYIALFASVLTSFLCIYAVALGLMQNPSDVNPERGSYLFRLYTVNSNVFAALGATMMIPFAIEGIRKKRFTYPKWLQILQQSGVICTTLTMIFATFFILPYKGFEITFTGMNFFLHLVCPIMNMILLFCTECNVELTPFDSFIGLIPFYIYALVYIFKVALLGKENGGWRDIYRLTTILPAMISTSLLFVFSFGLAHAIRRFYNRFVRKRREEMEGIWSDDLSPVELKVEAYGLGRYNGMHDNINTITAPFDIFLSLSEKYPVRIDELTRAYDKGVVDGLKERDKYYEKKIEDLSRIVGTPEKLANKDI